MDNFQEWIRMQKLSEKYSRFNVGLCNFYSILMTHYIYFIIEKKGNRSIIFFKQTVLFKSGSNNNNSNNNSNFDY